MCETEVSAAELSLGSTKLSQNCVGLSYMQQNWVQAKLCQVKSVWGWTIPVRSKLKQKYPSWNMRSKSRQIRNQVAPGKIHIFKNSWFWVLLHFSSIINLLTWTGPGVTAPLWYSSTYLTPILCLDLKSSKLRACSTCCTAGTCTASWPRRPYTVNWKIMWQLCAWWLELQDKLTTVC